MPGSKILGLVKETAEEYKPSKVLPNANSNNTASKLASYTATAATNPIGFIDSQLMSTGPTVPEKARLAVKELDSIVPGANVTRTLDSISGVIDVLKSELVSGRLRINSDYSKAINALILNKLNMATVQTGVVYRNLDQSLSSATKGVVNDLQLPIPMEASVWEYRDRISNLSSLNELSSFVGMGADTALKSKYDDLPTWGTIPGVSRQGVGTDFYWGIELGHPDLIDTDGETIPNYAPPSPYEDLGSKFSSATFAKGGGYIPAKSYDIIYRKIGTKQSPITSQFSLNLPIGYEYPAQLTFEIDETDLYIWDKYLRNYYNVYYRNGILTPYKNICSTIAITVFYQTGKLYFHKQFYCIPDFDDFSLSGSSQKNNKSYSLKWNVYGESDRNYISSNNELRAAEFEEVASDIDSKSQLTDEDMSSYYTSVNGKLKPKASYSAVIYSAENNKS